MLVSERIEQRSETGACCGERRKEEKRSDRCTLAIVFACCADRDRRNTGACQSAEAQSRNSSKVVAGACA
jgi:hypothetical protein